MQSAHGSVLGLYHLTFITVPVRYPEYECSDSESDQKFSENTDPDSLNERIFTVLQSVISVVRPVISVSVHLFFVVLSVFPPHRLHLLLISSVCLACLFLIY